MATHKIIEAYAVGDMSAHDCLHSEQNGEDSEQVEGAASDVGQIGFHGFGCPQA